MSDQISSIRFFGNAEVTVYQLEGFGGRSILFDRDIRNLESAGWNESLSSVRVTRGYQGGRYGDRSGDYRAGDGGLRAAYLEVLGREPDAEGRALYEGHMRRDNWTEADVQEALMRTPEYRDRNRARARGDCSQTNVPRSQDVDAVIRRVYLEVLRRDADGASLTEYRTRFANDRWTEQDLRHALETSEEYRHRNLGSAPSGPDPDATVRRIYQEVLKRDA
ncbi:MAG: hypothetical protein ABIR28_14185, partial [Vicinamibacteria bacterium]